MTGFDFVRYFSNRSLKPRPLSELEAVLELLDNPQSKFRSIHVAGTNGKGSTCAYIANILMEAGYETGLYTSPALIRVNDRIRINGIPVSDDLIAAAAFRVSEAEMEANVHLSGFDRMTATALCVFANCRVDIVVLETGLGGRLDATNVADSELALITTIALDHTQVLGSTYEEIAAEKCGIIRSNQVVISHPQQPEVMDIIEDTCRRKNCLLLRVDDCIVEREAYSTEGQYFTVTTPEGAATPLFTSMLGVHQLDNAVAAMLAGRALHIDPACIQAGIEQARWPARMEYFPWDPDILIDGAHNPNAARALVKGLNDYFPNRFVVLIVAIMHDKDADEVMRILAKRANYIIAVSVNERSLPPEELVMIAQRYTHAPTHISDTVSHAYVEALQFSVNNYDLQPLIVAAGSLYLCGDMLRMLY
ncbi:MAG: bifunctional folylpolyglutamate synthase/dihydrofolate synthase [Christensenellales bacterium]|jgi:dihydrofolate synthase/folylpolyglutamate synthase